MNELVSRLHPRISSLLMDLEKATYELDEESYQANEINDPYVVVLFSSTTELLHERYKVKQKNTEKHKHNHSYIHTFIQTSSKTILVKCDEKQLCIVG